MANFIFNEGAALMGGTGLNWVADDYYCSLVDDALGRDVVQTDTWADLSAFSTAETLFSNKSITTAGAVAAAPVIFNSVSPTDPDGRFIGFAIKKASDDTLVAWFDSGVNQLGPDTRSQPLPYTQPILGAAIQAATVTFTIRPGINNENAWFRP